MKLSVLSIRRRHIARGLVLGGTLLLQAPAAQALDAQSCQALRGHQSKFSLGLASCSPTLASTPPAPALLPRAAQAQQLHLFEPLSTASPEAARTDATPQSVPRQRGQSPARPGRQVPRVVPGVTPTQPLPASLTRALQLAPAVERAALAHAIDPLLLHAIARVESRHDPSAVSRAGARGLMQVMPATGARFGVDQAHALHDAPTNLDVSARYLRILDRRFQGRLPLVLAAYNAGEGAVERHGRRIPPYAETQSYVRQVLTEYARLQSALERISH